jgi:hypothetical protein
VQLSGKQSDKIDFQAQENFKDRESHANILQ